MSAAASNLSEPERLYRIGDVSRLTDTKPFVLRFWETEFPMLQPVKAPRGHRLYRQEDVEMIRAIKKLLYEEGFTIAGARRHLADTLAGGTGIASPVERAPLIVTSAEFAPESGDAAAPDVRDKSLKQAKLPGMESTNTQRALVAVRQELRAILTLLGTR